MLLADSVEAASAAVRPNNAEAIERLVNKIIDDHIKDGQLDDSGLTLGDIKTIRDSFIETLKGRFHVRVRYPDNEELMAPQPQETVSTPQDAPVAARPQAIGRPVLTQASQGESS